MIAICMCRRARQEYVREELREANQARGAGMQLGGGGGGVDSLGPDAWLTQVRAGRKKAATMRGSEEVFKVLKIVMEEMPLTAASHCSPVSCCCKLETCSHHVQPSFPGDRNAGMKEARLQTGVWGICAGYVGVLRELCKARQRSCCMAVSWGHLQWMQPVSHALARGKLQP